MAEKTLNTRIQLKYDTLANWNNSSLILKKGEVAFATVPTVEGSTLEPVMFKVGDGSKTFAQLDWASAKAADVYGWAKAAGLPIDATTAPEGQFVEGFAWENNKLVPKFRGFITEINETNKNKLDAPTTKAVKEYVDGVAANIVAQGTVVAAGDKIDVAQTGNTYTISHETIAQAEAGKTVAARTYVTGVTTDGYGHITGYTTATEEDQDLSGYKTKQEAVSETGAADKTLKISQDTNGVITATPVNIAITASQVTDFATEVAEIKVKSATNADNATTAAKVDNALTVGNKTFDGSAAVEVTAADLGLESAMHFVGALSEAPENPKAGDVYLNTATKKEYVYDTINGWVELGDEGSYALRSVKIIANEGLEGGGDLTVDRTIGIAANGVTTTKIADANVTKAKLATDVQATLDKADSALQPAALNDYSTTQDMLTLVHLEGFAYEGNVNSALEGKVARNSGAVNDNIAIFYDYGQIKDSGKNIAGIIAEAVGQANKYFDDNFHDNNTEYSAAADGGLKLDGTAFSIDDSLTWIFDCGGAND